MLVCGSPYAATLIMGGEQRHVPPKRRLIFNSLYGATSHKRELIIAAAVRSPDPTAAKPS
jgi:hypothetical protein